MAKKPKIGDAITVKVGGVEYPVFVDPKGKLRFKPNEVVSHILDRLNGTPEGARLGLDMNGLRTAYNAKKFSKREYAEYHMLIGYSLDGFCELSPFEDMEVETPEWTRK